MATGDTDSSGRLHNDPTTTDRLSGSQPGCEGSCGCRKLCNHPNATEGQSGKQPAFEGRSRSTEPSEGFITPFQRGLQQLHTSDMCMDCYQSDRGLCLDKVGISAACGVPVYATPAPAARGGIAPGLQQRGPAFSTAAPAASCGITPGP